MARDLDVSSRRRYASDHSTNLRTGVLRPVVVIVLRQAFHQFPEIGTQLNA